MQLMGICWQLVGVAQVTPEQIKKAMESQATFPDSTLSPRLAVCGDEVAMVSLFRLESWTWCRSCVFVWPRLGELIGMPSSAEGRPCVMGRDGRALVWVSRVREATSLKFECVVHLEFGGKLM